MQNEFNESMLSSNFMPAVVWNSEYRKELKQNPDSQNLIIALERPNGNVSVYQTQILPHRKNNKIKNIKYVERLLKFLLWMKGGCRIKIAGSAEIAGEIAKIYSPHGKRAFDYDIFGRKIYGRKFEVLNCGLDEVPEENETELDLGGNFDGCRIGFDLGGSDRKCAALIDGKVVHSEEISWNPYFQKDPEYHISGIRDSIKRAAEKLPRVDAIGGSAAGVYVDNKVRVASLFRGVSEKDFKNKVTNVFLEIQNEWHDVPMTVVNDGDVTALAGAMNFKKNGVLGISMGTSEAVGYVTPDGHVTDWLNELAFAPFDYSELAPEDEWSGDIGCGAQYFSQQGVARFAENAGIKFPDSMSLPERLEQVQNKVEQSDSAAEKIYIEIGKCFAYAVAHYSEFYDFSNLLILGRVSSGRGGEIILESASDVLKENYPMFHEKISFRTPDEKSKRHGQAVAAAGLPTIKK